MTYEHDNTSNISQRILNHITNRPFPQQNEMNINEFSRFLSDRDLKLSRSVIENWDRYGLMHPICRFRFDLLPEITDEMMIDQSLIPQVNAETPNDDDFIEWNKLQFNSNRKIGWENNTGISFHPWQIFHAYESMNAWKSVSRQSMVDGIVKIKNLEDYILGNKCIEINKLKSNKIHYLKLLYLLILGLYQLIILAAHQPI
jgi:hypothetical protein